MMCISTLELNTFQLKACICQPHLSFDTFQKILRLLDVTTFSKINEVDISLINNMVVLCILKIQCLLQESI